MLWHRAWCETRARFAIGAGALTVVCVLAIAPLRHGAGAEAEVWAAVYGDAVKTIFLLVVIVLGAGSLRQEHMLGTLGFTLALPVTRSRLLAARAGVGIAEVWALAALVALWVPAVSALAGDGYPISQSLRFGVIWGACGSLVLCVALLLATLIASDYLAWLGTFLSVIGYEAVVNVTELRRYPVLDLYRVMSGDGQAWFDAHAVRLVGVPWGVLAVVALAGGAVLGLADLRTRRLEL